MEPIKRTRILRIMRLGGAGLLIVGIIGIATEYGKIASCSASRGASNCAFALNVEGTSLALIFVGAFTLLASFAVGAFLSDDS